MTEVNARVVGALDSRADVPSDSDSDAPREGRGGDPLLDPEEDSGEEDDDDSEEHADDHRTLAEVLGDVQASANVIFSQRDVASAETKLRALARVPAGLLSEETLDEHLDATLAACRDDETLGVRRLVFTSRAAGAAGGGAAARCAARTPSRLRWSGRRSTSARRDAASPSRMSMAMS